MTNLSQLVDVLAAEVVLADPADPQGLARLHEQFDVAGKAAGADSGSTVAQQIAKQTKEGRDILERLILGEAPNIEQAMLAVTRVVSELQATLNGPASPAAAAPAAAAHEITAGAYEGAEPDFGVDGDVEMAREFISEANTHVESAEAALLAMESNSEDPEPVKSLFRAFHTIKGTAGFVNLKQIPRLAHVTENLLDLARQGQLEVTGVVADVVLEAIDKMKSLVASLMKAVETKSAPDADAELPQLLARVEAAAAGQEEPQAKPGVDERHAPVVQATEAPAPTNTPASIALQPSEPVAKTTRATGESVGSSAEATVKVATERLDRLINSVGELVIAQAMLEQSLTVGHEAAVSTARGLTHLGKLTRELQDLAMSMRMVPIQGVFQKMARLARDLTRKSEKQIEFTSHGGETELDRNLVEAISDPLVHMIRNSADHGIESPDVRDAAGKPRTGKITLSAYHQGGSVVIEIRDDGKGLAKKRILQKAIDRGIVRPEQTLSDQEIFALIFHAGLSTAEKVTDVSGRGVGMDVVKRNIESLRGRIEIDSTEGVGTLFTIRLPLTLAVIDGLVVRVGSERFVIPLLGIEQSMRLSAEQVSTVQGRSEMAMVRNSLIPLTRLHRMFSINGAIENVTDGLVVIVQDNLRRRGLLVDGLLGRQQVVIKSLGEGIGQTKGISGGAILGDGKVSLILDVPSLLDLSNDL